MLILIGLPSISPDDLLLVSLSLLVTVLSLERERNNPSLLFPQLRLSIALYAKLLLSQAALYIAKNLIFHGCTKHIEIDCHFVRDCLLANVIYLHHVSCGDQMVDILTKPLAGPLHHSFLHKLGIFTPSGLGGC